MRLIICVVFKIFYCFCFRQRMKLKKIKFMQYKPELKIQVKNYQVLYRNWIIYMNHKFLQFVADAVVVYVLQVVWLWTRKLLYKNARKSEQEKELLLNAQKSA